MEFFAFRWIILHAVNYSRWIFLFPLYGPKVSLPICSHCESEVYHFARAQVRRPTVNWLFGSPLLASTDLVVPKSQLSLKMVAQKVSWRCVLSICVHAKWYTSLSRYVQIGKLTLGHVHLISIFLEHEVGVFALELRQNFVFFFSNRWEFVSAQSASTRSLAPRRLLRSGL